MRRDIGIATGTGLTANAQVNRRLPALAEGPASDVRFNAMLGIATHEALFLAIEPTIKLLHYFGEVVY